MDYQKVYNQIVERAKKEQNLRLESKLNGIYFEGHHIVPRCLGGTGYANNWNHINIVGLTAREHFLCHWLLTRIHINNDKIAYAFWAMCNGRTSKNQKRHIPSSRQYEEAKIKIGKIVSKNLKGIVRSEETKRKCSIAQLGNKKGLGSHRTEEWKLAQSNLKKGIPRSEKDKITLKDAQKHRRGIPLSDEVKKKISDKLKGRTISDEHKKKLIIANTGRVLSQETLDKMSLAAKNRWNGKRK